ncbi:MULTISPECIES: hypothetical protein [unclassified Nocardia]|uniref:hypothetical protein n=1 Tax=unclassified Nocardia TaxID=2637762 RepID=UPI00278C4084|nr:MULTISPECIES: hypothetical protein [unclassified Nocardia]
MTEVFDADIEVTIRPVSDTVGLPFTVNPAQLADREMLIEIREGAPGPAGGEGAPAWPWEWQGDIADVAALEALGLGTSDARKAWRVVAENTIYYWTGLDFIPFADSFGADGHQGAPTALTGSAVAGPTGASAAAALTGTPPTQHLEITFPRGETGEVGDPGDPGRIQDAADVLIDTDHRLAQDYVLAWGTGLGKFRPVPNPRLGGPWAIAGSQFSGGSGLNTPTKVVATMTIPSQPHQWRPIVEGGVVALAHVQSVGDTRVDIEVRLGDPETGDLIAFGAGVASANNHRVLIGPRYSFAASPASTFGVVPANTTTTLYVVARRVVGTGNYSVTTSNAQLIVYAQAVRT